ncbi:MAG: MFS transporter, partial [Myxococcota bacterium]|nr:MFS transporter [Myxococcota bacterium]
MRRPALTKMTLLLTSMMTMMAGAVVAPSLPQINAVFQSVPQAALLTRLVITLPAIFIAIFSPIYGYLIDRSGRKRLLLFALMLYGLAGTSGAYLHDLHLILLGRAVLGIAVAGIMTIATTLVGDYFQGKARSSFIGFQSSFIGLGGVCFIALAGWAADIHWQAPFYIYLFSFPVLLLAIFFLPEPNPSRPAVSLTDQLVGQPVDYPKLKLTVIYSIIFVCIVFFYMMPVQIPFFLKQMPGVSNAMVGYGISISTLASAVVAMNYRRVKQRLSFPLIYAIAFAALGIGYIAVSFSTTYTFSLLALVISGAGIGLMMPSGNLWIMELAPASLRGRLVGRGSTAMFLGMFFSPIL